MIHVIDALTLARAKLHSHRILLIFTVLTSCLLFGALFGISFCLKGIDTSMRTFNEQAHNGRYLVKAAPIIPNDIYPNNASLNKKTVLDLIALQTEYTAQQKQLSKELNISFNEDLIEPPLKPSPFTNPALPADEQLMVNFDSPIYKLYAEKLLSDYVQKATNTREHLRETANKYAVRDVFSTISSQTNFTNTVYLPDGHESLDYLLKTAEPASSGLTTYGYAVNSVKNSEYTQVDDSLLQNWILQPNQNTSGITDDDAVPVVITTKEATALFGKSLNIAAEPAQSAEKIKWVQDIQRKINGITYTSCYRNDAERLRIAQAMKDLSNIKANVNNKDFVIPVIIYNLPTEPCGEMTVKKDSRTQKERQDDQKNIEIQKRLNAYTEPVSRLIKFKVIGVIDMNERTFSTPRTIDDFANNLFANTLSSGALIPKNMYEKSEASKRYDDVLFGQNTRGDNSSDLFTKYGLTESILTFNDLSSARDFIKNEGCSEQESECSKLYRLDPYGSNYLLLDDLQTSVKRTVDFALPVATMIAGVISILTISRIIIDSRRETAVFRALGAKRIDIISIYVVYGLFVSILTTISSIIMGLALSIVAENLYSNNFTLDARVAFGLFNSSSIFSFIGIDAAQIILLSLAILATTLGAVLFSLIWNVRRSPISDMRSDN